MRSPGLAAQARDNGGQSLVEVALMLPVLLLIVLGLVDIGRTYAAKSAVTNAARDAAVHAARDPQASGSSICQRAVDELGGGGCRFDAVTGTWRGTTMPIAVTCVRIVPARIVPAGIVPAGPIACDTGADPLDQELSAADVHVTVVYEVSLLSMYFLERVASAGRVTVGASALVAAAGR